MIVVDTSVAFKWVHSEEENYEKALKILNQHLLGDEEIIVPDLFFYELTNAWSTKSTLSALKIKKNLEKIKKYSLTVIPLELTRLNKTISFAKKYSVSVYDATYAVIALEKKCRLITADTKFIKKINKNYIISL